MNVSVGERWEEFIEQLVEAGRYDSPNEVVREGLRLVREQEAKLQALRDMVNTSIEEGEGRGMSDEEVGAAIAARVAELRAKAP